MPSDMICTYCRLAFQVGWFHYHKYTDHPTASYLVCTNCGTMHLIEFGRTEPISVGTQAGYLLRFLMVLGARLVGRRDADFPREPKATGMPDRLSAQPCPIHVGEDITQEHIHVCIPENLSEWIECGELADLRPWRKGPSCEITEGCKDPVLLNELLCNYCKTKGCLTDEWPLTFKVCPHCGKKTIEHCGSWMT
ncbi:MAG TPA: hypothetical protein VMX13_03670 [Sedimentisphaerales bacterium]|nr:hypothetical protein [Sedimentisphaerales bacterium]